MYVKDQSIPQKKSFRKELRWLRALLASPFGVRNRDQTHSGNKSHVNISETSGLSGSQMLSFVGWISCPVHELSCIACNIQDTPKLCAHQDIIILHCVVLYLVCAHQRKRPCLNALWTYFASQYVAWSLACIMYVYILSVHPFKLYFILPLLHLFHHIQIYWGTPAFDHSRWFRGKKTGLELRAQWCLGALTINHWTICRWCTHVIWRDFGTTETEGDSLSNTYISTQY